MSATKGFVLKRVVNRLVTLFGLVFVLFLVFEVIPQALGLNLGFFFTGANPLANPKGAQGQINLIQQAVSEFHLLAPIYVRFGYFALNLFTFNFGMSTTFKEPVVVAVLQYLPNTLVLATASLLTTSGISVALGVAAARSNLSLKGRAKDYAYSLFSIATYFIPIFWVGMIIYVVFTDQLHLFPINLAYALNGGGTHSYTGVQYYLRYIWAAILPIGVLTMVGFGHRQQLLRNNIMEEYSSAGYVSFLRARGVPDRQVFYKHAFRNAILPWVTQIGLDIAFLIYGIYFIEVLFNFPGMGWASVQAADFFDITFLAATTFIFALYTLAVLTLLDFVYARLDPRIQLS